LLSDEAGFNHRLLHPSAAHRRTYWAQVEGVPDEMAMQRLRRGGIEIQNYRTLPCGAEILDPEPTVAERNPPVRFRKSIPTSWIELRLTEGKNRQVRRMTAAVGYPTLRLIRAAIGSFELGALAQGEWRALEKSDLEKVWA
jgi:23S rRNA pseudouridine2457 synthase